MNIVVQKFGGTSVKNVQCLENVANIAINEYDKGNKIVVVVSAQSGVTDSLILKSKEISPKVSDREFDVLVSTGEQITASLLCMLLHEKGRKAISFMGWQLPIITNHCYCNADIKYIETSKIIDKLNEDYIVVIAGFQGIDENNNITTLGRGGSDTTAVALAAFLKANKCEIYTDVDGVYTSDPNIDSKAKKIDVISYNNMLNLANTGAKVLHNKCVEYAKKNNVIIHVKSSFESGKGTIVKGI